MEIVIRNEDDDYGLLSLRANHLQQVIKTDCRKKESGKDDWATIETLEGLR